MGSYTILVFASRDSVQAAQARALAARVDGRFIDRLSNDLEDLTLVARYRVVEPAVVVILVGDRIVGRIPRLVTVDELLRDLHSLT